MLNKVIASLSNLDKLKPYHPNNNRFTLVDVSLAGLALVAEKGYSVSFPISYVLEEIVEIRPGVPGEEARDDTLLLTYDLGVLVVRWRTVIF